MPQIEPLTARDPRRLGAYRLLGRLGRGGQGVVYLGMDASDTKVAVKLFTTHVTDSESVLRRFRTEMETVRRVAPFCTAQVLDAHIDEDRPYIVSEYVDGPSLEAYVHAEGPREGGALDRIAVGTATALAAIHHAGVVHRDFKPENVLMGIDGLRVVDFGIARLLGPAMTTSQIIGTPPYMAPEQINGKAAGPAADMFGWAATIVYAATGHLAFPGDTPPAVIGRILYGQPDLDGLAGHLRALVTACLAHEPQLRPSAVDVLRELRGDADRPAAETPSAPPSHLSLTRPPSPPRRPSGPSVHDPSVPRPSAVSPVGTGNTADAPLPGSTHPGVRLRSKASARNAVIVAVLTVAAVSGVVATMANVTSGMAERDGDAANRTPGAAGGQGAKPGETDSNGSPIVTPAPASPKAGTTPDPPHLPSPSPSLKPNPPESPTPKPKEKPSFVGTWEGSLRRLATGTVGPVKILLTKSAAEGLRRTSMLWGADYHCAATLTRTGASSQQISLRLSGVSGYGCNGGTVILSELKGDRVTLRVVNADGSVRMSGSARR